MSIGENIKKIRTEKGLEQCKLAEMVNVTAGMMSQIERGTKIPSMLLGRDIARVLGCGIEDLFGNDAA